MRLELECALYLAELGGTYTRTGRKEEGGENGEDDPCSLSEQRRPRNATFVAFRNGHGLFYRGPCGFMRDKAHGELASRRPGLQCGRDNRIRAEAMAALRRRRRRRRAVIQKQPGKVKRF